MSIFSAAGCVILVKKMSIRGRRCIFFNSPPSPLLYCLPLRDGIICFSLYFYFLVFLFSSVFYNIECNFLKQTKKQKKKKKKQGMYHM